MINFNDVYDFIFANKFSTNCFIVLKSSINKYLLISGGIAHLKDKTTKKDNTKRNV